MFTVQRRPYDNIVTAAMAHRTPPIFTRVNSIAYCNVVRKLMGKE